MSFSPAVIRRMASEQISLTESPKGSPSKTFIREHNVIIEEDEEEAAHCILLNPNPLVPEPEPESAPPPKPMKYEQKLFQGVTDLNLDNFQKLLQKEQLKSYFNVNAKDVRTGDTLVHVAATRGKRDILDLLLNSAADCNSQDGEKHTPLHLAIQHRHDDCSRRLLDCKELEIHMCNNDQDTPLHIATMKKRSAVCHWILELPFDSEEAKIGLINAKNQKSCTPLHYAVQENCSDVVRLLLENGADRTIEDSKGYLPLHYAAERGYSDCLELLLSSMNDLERLSHLECYTKNGKTPLLLAAKGGFRRCCTLMKYGNMNIKDKLNGRTALHYAVRAKHFEDTVRELLRCGANPNSIDNKGNSPIHEAIEREQYGCLRILVEYDAVLNVISSQNKNILHMAAQKNASDMLEFLLSPEMEKKWANLGGALALKDDSHNTPLHIALINGYGQCAQLLLQKGSSPIESTYHGRTPLHLAAEKGCQSVCEFLLSRPEVRVNEEEGESKDTALHLAACMGSEAICNLLVNKGAKLHASNNEGMTPMHMAASNGHANVINYLKRRGANGNIADDVGLRPLHLAADNGFLECCEMLVKCGAKACWSKDDKGDLPLNKAFKNRNEVDGNLAEYDETFKFLLNEMQIKEEITDQAQRIHEYMDKALEEKRETIIEAIVNSCCWRSAFTSNDHQCENFRKLIKDYPNFALQLMKGCVYPDDKINPRTVYDFCLLEDNFYLPPAPNSMDCSPYDPKNHKVRPKAKAHKQGLPWKKNHPVYLMMREGRFDLLNHTVTREWLRQKWRSHLACIFWILLIIEILYATLLVLYMGFAHNWLQVKEICRFTQREFCEIAEYEMSIWGLDENKISMYGRMPRYSHDVTYRFEDCNRHAGWRLAWWSLLLIFTVITLLLEVNKLYRLRLVYFRHFEHAIQVLKIVFTIVVLIPLGSCHFYYGILNVGCWQVGVLAILLAWLHLAYSVNLIPGLAIFMPITKTFLKGFLIALFYVVVILFTFAFIFYLLLQNLDTFMDVPQAMMRTAAWMTGEAGYDDAFLDRERIIYYPIMTGCLFIIFITILAALIANVFVQPSSALDFLKKTATFHKISQRTELFLNLDVCFPWFLRMTTVDKRVHKESSAASRESFLTKKIQKLFLLDNKEIAKPIEKDDAIQEQLQKLNQQFSSALSQYSQQEQEIATVRFQLGMLTQSIQSLERVIRKKALPNLAPTATIS